MYEDAIEKDNFLYCYHDREMIVVLDENSRIVWEKDGFLVNEQQYVIYDCINNVNISLGDVYGYEGLYG